ncbi:MAG TPA: 50S ribosomal protein L18 [Candidatus Bathyarchaeia archaeon]|nr:50S ribosomal protein L18 [Candidatus Bathyarchaeia archaeon]
MIKKGKIRRKIRIRSKIRGTADRPRLSVFRSNKLIYAQVIDDEKRQTIVAVNDKYFDAGKRQESKTKRAFLTGKILAQKALEKKVRKVVFDRGSFRYHGRLKALAEGAREGGLIF